MTRIELERRERGWNQTVLAYHAQITQSEVSLIERRRLSPSPRYMQRIARALNLPVNTLLDEVGGLTESLSEVGRGCVPSLVEKRFGATFLLTG